MAMALPNIDRIEALTQRIVGRIGQSVTYKPAGGPSRSITCLVQVKEELDQDDFADGEQRIQRAILTISDDPTTGISEVNEGDRFEFEGSTWAPDRWSRLDGIEGAHTVQVVRNVGVRKSHFERIRRKGM